MPVHAYRSQILYMQADPRLAGEKDAVQFFEDGLLVLEDGHVAKVGPYKKIAGRLPKDVSITPFENALITPGFIDTHIHFPQTDIIGANGTQLLDWLNNYTYPVEAAFADEAYARDTARFFIEELLRNGTTSAMVFATSHGHSVDAVFESALEKNMRLVSGKVLMNRNAPEALCDGPDHGRDETLKLIKKWRGKGRLGYAVTPRFAMTSTAEQLKAAGELLAEHSDLYLQTHLSENEEEVRLTRNLFPEARDYLDIYARYGLVTNRSVFAHALHMSDDAFERIANAGASISFCPTSNLFLGSGLFDLEAARRNGVNVSLGTDVGAGVSFSLLQTMKSAYEVSQLLRLSIDPYESLYMATLGGAKALAADDAIGHLAPGAEADFIVLDLAATPLIARRMRAARSLKERLFALMVLGDDRAVARTYVAGACVHERGAQY